MTNPIPSPPDSIETPVQVNETNTSFSSGASSIFQATAPLNDLAKESVETGKTLVEEVSQFGSSLVQNVGEVMAEP
ncbi:MAG: hypothetical protein LBU27_07295 [Candidatus Peribacteria bacterium]|jgi:hypothetical protein|nr:hypothetical protein [Candidatus Peribacteria bacterium]